jgi:KDO2-lipid IV(A) lauroyltransferase
MFISILDIFILLFVRSVCWVVKVLPDRVSFFISYIITLCIIFAMPRFKKVALRNLELVFPEKTLAERKKIMRASFKELATNIYSFAKNPRLTEQEVDKILVQDKREEIMRVMGAAQAQAAGKGILIATAHFGNFELGSQFYSFVFGPVFILARGFKLRRFNAWWNSRREMFGHTVFDRAGAYREIEHRLSAGNMVAVLFDQNVVKKHAVFVDFFGIKAATTKSLALAVLRTGAPFVLVVLVRIGFDRYTYRAMNITIPSDTPEFQKLSLDEKVALIMEQTHRGLEQYIRENPEHWFWIHRRFKTRPSDKDADLYQGI